MDGIGVRIGAGDNMPNVAPIIPNAQENKGPALFLQALHGGLSFMSQMAQQRRQSESDIARMALQERLANQEQDFNAQKMAQDYGLQDRKLKIEEGLLEPRKKLFDAQADYYSTTKGATARQSAAKIATLTDFNKQVSKYGLDDPNPRDPVAFYANVRRLKDEFSWANMPEVKHSLKQIEMRTKEHTIPLQVNQEVTDVDGEKVIRSVEKFVPIAEIIEGLKDPKKYDHVMRTLERSGLMKEDGPIPANKVLREFIQAETKKVEAGGGTDFSRSSSRVAPGGPLSDPADVPEKLPDDPATPDVDESNLFGSIGQTEKYLAQARAALKRGAAPKAVAERLSGVGVDPNQLWAT